MKIVYNSFHGRYSDNPRAVFEALSDADGVEHLWLADPLHAASFPAGVRTVPIDGPDAVAALESADLLIANTHTEVEWRKPAGTTYVQTWHGTPLKRIHHDVLWAPEGRLDRLDHDVERWDVLISPNPASTPRLRQAFRYDGEVLEIGYPRNDVLSDPDRDELRAVVRKELGLEEGTTAVLYAPTWRDDEGFMDGAPPVPLGVDLTALASSLGSDHTLLTRLHPLMTGRSTIPSLPTVRDVSYFADVRHLYLAADVLVTDYSSSMFDFVITGKPVILHAYDLVRFRDSVRGFYFDLVPEAPGPVTATTAELHEALVHLPELRSRYAERYAAFRARYCGLEDGHATQRLLTRLQLNGAAPGTTEGRLGLVRSGLGGLWGEKADLGEMRG